MRWKCTVFCRWSIGRIEVMCCECLQCVSLTCAHMLDFYGTSHAIISMLIFSCVSWEIRWCNAAVAWWAFLIYSPFFNWHHHSDLWLLINWTDLRTVEYCRDAPCSPSNAICRRVDRLQSVLFPGTLWWCKLLWWVPFQAISIYW